MFRLPKFFCPNSKTKLIRLGKFNDGGYSIPVKSLKDTQILFSFGLDDDWSFEEHFKEKTYFYRKPNGQKRVFKCKKVCIVCVF